MPTSSSLSKLSCDCGFVLVLLRFLKFEIGVDKASSSLWLVVVLLDATGFDLVRFTNTGASSVMAGFKECYNFLPVHAMEASACPLTPGWSI